MNVVFLKKYSTHQYDKFSTQDFWRIFASALLIAWLTLLLWQAQQLANGSIQRYLLPVLALSLLAFSKILPISVNTFNGLALAGAAGCLSLTLAWISLGGDWLAPILLLLGVTLAPLTMRLGVLLKEATAPIGVLVSGSLLAALLSSAAIVLLPATGEQTAHDQGLLAAGMLALASFLLFGLRQLRPRRSTFKDAASLLCRRLSLPFFTVFAFSVGLVLEPIPKGR